ncbi:MAG: PorV/PorQ family protein [Elusimicrobia bacterium]|nr:PorV/PorQ family protein [Elusimicrobiota bacterium]
MKGIALAWLGALLLLLAPQPAWPAFSASARGGSAATFLKIGAGARAAAMGEAQAADPQGAEALFWNPAALSRVSGCSVSFTHAAHIAMSSLQYGAYAQRLRRAGSIAAGFQRSSAGAIDETDESGTVVGSFSPFDLAVSAGYGVELSSAGPRFLRSVSMGLGFKYIRSQIINSAESWAEDIGILSPALWRDRLRFAFTARNLGPGLRYEAATEDLPLELRLGSALRAGAWAAVLDLGLPRDNAPFAAAGLERRWEPAPGMSVAGRLGLNSSRLGLPGGAGLCFGFGISGRGMGLDYAIVPLGYFGLGQRVSLQMAF